MISLDFNFNILTRDLSHYLENQVRVGLLGSGVGLYLVLGFSAAYTCYYLISVAKVRAVGGVPQRAVGVARGARTPVSGFAPVTCAARGGAS